MRDYIHVTDLALGAPFAALQALPGMTCVVMVNLGTGQGYSVLEMVQAFEVAPYCIVARRPGDIGACYADRELALELLGWRAERGIEAMCRNAWRWQLMNPEGYLDND